MNIFIFFSHLAKSVVLFLSCFGNSIQKNHKIILSNHNLDEKKKKNAAIHLISLRVSFVAPL